jgi:hypothetical protein
MKSDTTTTLLNMILAVLVVLGVVFTLMSMMRTRQLRNVQPMAMQASQKIMLIQSLAMDVNNYNQQAKSPEIARMLQTFQTQISAIK